MENKLKEVLQIVNDWLKFAEAKVAGLLAFNTGILYLVLDRIDDIMNLNNIVIGLVLLIWSLNLTSVLICFVAITARTRHSEYYKSNKEEENLNLLYYGDISKFDEEELLTVLSKRYNLESSSKALEFDYAKQIIINSHITLTKLKRFNTAIRITFASFLLMPISFAVYLYLSN